jgi:hypothetical protein
MKCRQIRLKLAVLAGSLFLVVSARSAGEDLWKVSETAAAKAAKSAHFAQAERLLSANLNLAGNLRPKDPRRPRTLFDLAEVYRRKASTPRHFPSTNARFRSTRGFTAPTRPRSPTP